MSILASIARWKKTAARLRFFIMALHTEEQIRYTVEMLAEELEKIRLHDTIFGDGEQVEEATPSPSRSRTR